MDTTRSVGSHRYRVVVAYVYAAAAVVVLIWALPRSWLAAPAILIALSVPLILRLVPRNRLYGLRTSRTMRGPEEAWYGPNVVTGIVGAGIGLVWLIVAVVSR